MPEWLRNEAKQRTLAETAQVLEEWENFVFQNYYSDMTPTTRGPVMARLLPLEIINTYGIFKEEAWERFFFNEVRYEEPTKTEDLKEALNPYNHYELDTEEGRREFENKVQKFINMYPGSIVPEGESFDFKQFYAKHAILHGKDTGKFDPKLIEELKTKLYGDNTTSYALEGEEQKIGKNVVGKIMPKGLFNKTRKAIMSKSA